MTEWEFELDDLEAAEPQPLEPEAIDPENAAFVLLGVLLAIGVVIVLVP